MRKAKYIFLILFFIFSCRPDCKYGGLRVKFIGYQFENYRPSSGGPGYAYTLIYRVLKGNKHYKRDEIIEEWVYDSSIKIRRVKRKLGKKFNVIKDGYMLSWHLYF